MLIMAFGVADDFNPRSPHGERRCFARPPRNPSDFNPRSPHGERPFPCLAARAYSNFNPRSPHGERPDRPRRNRRGLRISIHAPRTGSDTTTFPFKED